MQRPIGRPVLPALQPSSNTHHFIKSITAQQSPPFPSHISSVSFLCHFIYNRSRPHVSWSHTPNSFHSLSVFTPSICMRYAVNTLLHKISSSYYQSFQRNSTSFSVVYIELTFSVFYWVKFLCHQCDFVCFLCSCILHSWTLLFSAVHHSSVCDRRYHQQYNVRLNSFSQQSQTVYWPVLQQRSYHIICK